MGGKPAGSARLRCECGTLKVDGRCPQCQGLLARPAHRRRAADRLLEEREKSARVEEFYGLPTVRELSEVSEQAARAMAGRAERGRW